LEVSVIEIGDVHDGTGEVSKGEVGEMLHYSCKSLDPLDAVLMRTTKE
jgi:hypothetical protein